MQSALKASNISDEVCEQIIEEAIASSQLGDLVSDMHTATWSVCTNEVPDSDDSVVWTKRGSRQGCPLEGIAFNLMHEQVLRKVRAAGERKESGRKSGRSGTCLPRLDIRHWITSVLADVAFVDDACFSFEAANSVSLVDTSSALLQIVDETCEAHVLHLNMNDGKTEFSIEMKGGGARKQFRRLWREDGKAHCISTNAVKKC